MWSAALIEIVLMDSPVWALCVAHSLNASVMTNVMPVNTVRSPQVSACRDRTALMMETVARGSDATRTTASRSFAKMMMIAEPNSIASQAVALRLSSAWTEGIVRCRTKPVLTTFVLCPMDAKMMMSVVQGSAALPAPACRFQLRNARPMTTAMDVNSVSLVFVSLGKGALTTMNALMDRFVEIVPASKTLIFAEAMTTVLQGLSAVRVLASNPNQSVVEIKTVAEDKSV